MGETNGGGLLENLQLFLPIIVIIIFGILLRRRKKTAATGGSKIDMVVGLLSEVKYNTGVAQSLSMNWQSKKTFRTDTWDRTRDKIGFLAGGVQSDLSTAFSLAGDFNDRISRSKQYKSDSYLMGIDTGKLTGALDKSKQGLEEWLKQNYQTQAPQRKGGLFG